MESRYRLDDVLRLTEARPVGTSVDLALRTYTARLLGQEPSLVLHGGGNTSAKSTERTRFGEEVPVMYIKGSGWDLATIEPAGHPAVRMDQLLKLLELPHMTDEDMVRGLRSALLDPGAPTPSVEALLHAALPYKFVDHTHASKVLALADQADAERMCGQCFGRGMVWVPYVMPGFDLAKRCAQIFSAFVAEGGKPTVMVLERHGVFTFGDTAQQSYENMINVVTQAERFIADRMRTVSLPSVPHRPELEARVLPLLRGAWAEVAGWGEERGPVLTVRSNELVLAFLESRDVEDLVNKGCATPDHVIRTKPTAMMADDVSDWTDDDARGHFVLRLRAYASEYDAYFETMCKQKSVQKKRLDPMPRVILVPKVGIVTVGANKEAADIAADIYEQTIQIMMDAGEVGHYAPVSRADLFDVEYWSLEQAKIKPVKELPLSGRVVLITGAASGIGLGTLSAMLEQGAHAVASDVNRERLDTAVSELQKKYGARVVAQPADVTNEADVHALFARAARHFGGVDVVLSNAGSAPEGRLDTAVGEVRLRTSLEVNLLSHASVAREAVKCFQAQKRGGCLLFNASKAALNPGPSFGPYAVAKAALIALMRQYAIDLGEHGVRANAVNADRVRTGLFDGGVLESRAKARGVGVDAYFRSNLLSREVRAQDVADAFVYLASARATTGAIVTVDGGNAAAFVR
jgi:rhamnose utilization protein RhaD (predicted bifunctional aldolase and dehydrogenase)/NAD(P)-dependent dehydrogenase (short-subunit alcohol dehydrogenase family)